MADAAQGEPAPDAPGTPAARTLTGFAKFGVLGMGVVYTIGVLIVNLHLGQYGIMSLDLARPEYVMAGFVWLLCEMFSGKSTVVVFWLNGVTEPKALAEERAMELSGPPWLATPVTIAATVPGGDADVEAAAAAFPSSNCDVLEATLEEKVIPVPGERPGTRNRHLGKGVVNG